MRNSAHMTGLITYWFCWFLYYRIHFVLILPVSLLQDPFRIDSAGFFTTESISYWFCWFLYYGIYSYWFCWFLYYGLHFVLILLVSLLRDPFRIDSVRFFTTESISYWFCWFLYYRIHFVFILSDSLIQTARLRRHPGRPTGGPENSFTEKQIFYYVGGSIFVAGWVGGFLGGRAEPSRVKGDESTRGFPKMRPDFDDRRSGS